MHLPLVEHLARRFRNRGEPLDDLIQVATIGLIKSVDRFDPERGVEFSTYATPTVVGEIKRHFRDKGWAVRVPRRLQELRLALTTATDELSQRHGRSPTVAELAEHLGSSRGGGPGGPGVRQRLLHPVAGRPGHRRRDSAGRRGHPRREDEALEGVEYRESLKPLLAELPPREQRILLLRFFGNMTQSQIAAEVGISQMHVSRLLARHAGPAAGGPASSRSSRTDGRSAAAVAGPPRSALVRSVEETRRRLRARAGRRCRPARAGRSPPRRPPWRRRSATM